MDKVSSRYASGVASLVFALLFVYFCYHAISGEHGLIALIELQNKVKERKIEADSIHAEKLNLEHRVSLLKPNSLDLDMLDEQARKLLGYAGKNETVRNIPTSNSKNNIN